jgi:3-oxoacyl-[acyl-carrier-protein] synthase II
MSHRRVVVTGLGMLSPVGNSVDDCWDAVCHGRSGIGSITEFDPEPLTTRIAGEIKGFDVAEYMPAREARRTDRFVHYGVAASIQALRHAGIEEDGHGLNPERIGFAIGAGIGGIANIEHNTEVFLEGGQRKVSPFFIPGSIVNMVGGYLSIRYGFKGPNIAIVTACTSATHNIGVAGRMIGYGEADVMVAGGAEYATTGPAMAGFCSARALSARNDDPERASRPWDRDRDGFVLSNGAGVIVLEEREHALRRGVPILAELVGFGMSADAHHMTAPPEDGAGAALCMKNALQDAKLHGSDVDYVNAHGTSTPLGDRAESDAVKQTFGADAYRLVVSSTKSMTGHCLGAAGGVEAIFSILAIQNGVVPPTINLEEPDDGCDLDYVPGTAREMKVDIAMSNSFGFGGTNGTLIFRRAGD